MHFIEGSVVDNPSNGILFAVSSIVSEYGEYVSIFFLSLFCSHTFC